MKGDVIIVEEHHRQAARPIAERLAAMARDSGETVTISIAGESGSGKSETALAVKEALEETGVQALILQQDDYFKLPPKSNDQRRRKDIDWVGMGEVHLDLLDQHLARVKSGRSELQKPLVIYDEDRIETETVSLDGIDAVIAEGTYTTVLKNADLHVFIDRTRLDTRASREKRAREPMDEFLEEVLEREHRIISRDKDRADVIISRDYEVTFRQE
jgi:uridine kinase